MLPEHQPTARDLKRSRTPRPRRGRCNLSCSRQEHEAFMALLPRLAERGRARIEQDEGEVKSRVPCKIRGGSVRHARERPRDGISFSRAFRAPGIQGPGYLAIEQTNTNRERTRAAPSPCLACSRHVKRQPSRGLPRWPFVLLSGAREIAATRRPTLASAASCFVLLSGAREIAAQLRPPYRRLRGA